MCRRVRVDQRNVTSALALVALASASGAALAQTTEDRSTAVGIHIGYEVLPECPDIETFRAELESRNRRLRAGEQVLGDLSVVVTREGSHLKGRLVLRVAGREVGARELEASTCAEVVSALAFVAAVDLDAAPSLRKPLAPEPADIPPEEPRPAPKPEPRTVWRVGVGAHASLSTGVADGLLFGAPVFVDFARSGEGLVAPSLRVVLEGAVSGQVTEAVGALRFVWLMAGVEACPLRFGGATLALRPCARLEGGALDASSLGVSFGHGAAEPWFAAGAALRGEWAPKRWIFFEIEGGARGNIARPSFAYLPATILYRAPVVSTLAEAGLGVRFF
jgi:hypothetical protein